MLMPKNTLDAEKGNKYAMAFTARCFKTAKDSIGLRNT
jgi:hypothetical protein